MSPSSGIIFVFLAMGACTACYSQATSTPPPKSASIYVSTNDLAQHSLNGDAQATQALSRQLFTNIGIPPSLADYLGFTTRISKAEVDFTHSQHSPAHESDVVRAINHVADQLGFPDWAHTNNNEVRKLRMHLLVVYPKLLGYRGRPDSHGSYKVLNDNMRPMEAAYVAGILLFQKVYNSEYQFTDAERKNGKFSDPSALLSQHLERTQELTRLLSGEGGSSSSADSFQLADRFFADLGIESVAETSAARRPIGGISTVGGGR